MFGVDLGCHLTIFVQNMLKFTRLKFCDLRTLARGSKAANGFGDNTLRMGVKVILPCWLISTLLRRKNSGFRRLLDYYLKFQLSPFLGPCFLLSFLSRWVQFFPEPSSSKATIT